MLVLTKTENTSMQRVLYKRASMSWCLPYDCMYRTLVHSTDLLNRIIVLVNTCITCSEFVYIKEIRVSTGFHWWQHCEGWHCQNH